MSEAELHKSSTRGLAEHGWLHSRHTFSFAEYYNPERVHFGVLRVLNDDIVAPGMGFGTHPHENMEIISIPLEGDLEHRDSMGNVAVIRKGDIQVMSAGTGITHSEYNKNKDRPVKFLQIWIFPKVRNVSPRYGQITFDPRDRQNRLQQVISPGPAAEGLWIHQDAWLHLGILEPGFSITYPLKKKGNGVYAFVINGAVSIDGNQLSERDGLGIRDAEQINLTAHASGAEVLLIEVPLALPGRS